MIGLDFNVTQTTCSALQICDITPEWEPCVELASTAYGYPGNTTKYDVDSTDFNITFPDGTVVSNIDLGFVPGKKAYGEFQITAGTSGTIVVDVNGVLLGNVIFTTDIQTTIDLLVNTINGNAAHTGWYAEDMGSSTIRVYSLKFGTAYNGLALNVGLSGTLAVLMLTDPTANAVGDGDCIDDVALSSWTGGLSPVPNALSGPAYPDGIYEITYTIYDGSAVQLATVTKKFLLKCQVEKCVKEGILSLGSSCCGDCEDKKVEKLLEVLSRIRQAEEQFAEGLFDCANDTIISVGKLCNKFCTDC